MQFVPWQNVSDWHCKACGYCCKLYTVVINFPEWLNIVKRFGVGTTVTGLDRLYIKRCSDGTCSFLCSSSNRYYCALQNMKPDACKIWPFKVLTEPKYGQPDQAAFDYNKTRLYIYVDNMCNGLRYGVPSWDFRYRTIPEFAELALRVRDVQHYATGRVGFEWRRML